MDKKRVMIVEDAAAMRMVIRNLLSADADLTVVKSAANGREALEALSATKPDLILLDLEMPEMDGLEFLRQGRSHTTAKIAVLTAVPADSHKLKLARLLGADATLNKPSGAVSFDLEEKRGEQFWQTIHALLNAAPVAA